ncbi:MAG TPA: hypothetical protein VFK06_21125 [Candidatus Angelobacter sp.]|nr:hypothetical protein [Candidatus Angelobacter sp.]
MSFSPHDEIGSKNDFVSQALGTTDEKDLSFPSKIVAGLKMLRAWEVCNITQVTKPFI